MNVNLELTDHCNIRCKMCSQSLRDEAHGAPHRFMDFETWSRALEGLAGLGPVVLCPHWLGEPTLHPEFDRFVRHAFSLNSQNRLFRHFKVHTNAVLLPRTARSPCWTSRRRPRWRPTPSSRSTAPSTPSVARPTPT